MTDGIQSRIPPNLPETPDARMWKATLLIVAAISLSTVLGASVYDAYPQLKQFKAQDAFSYEWNTTEEWRCPLFKERQLRTRLKVLKAGKCIHKAVTNTLNGPGVSCCGIQGKCDFRRDISYSRTRSATDGWKAGMQAKFGGSGVTGEWTFTAEYSGSITESAGKTDGTSMGWTQLEPGWIYVPKISFLEVHCTAIVYEDSPTIFGPKTDGPLWIEDHHTDGTIDSDYELMWLTIPEDRMCQIPEGILWWGKHDKTMQIPGNVLLRPKEEQGSGLKMHDRYRDFWRRSELSFPVLDSSGNILSVYGLEKLTCDKAAGYVEDEDGYLQHSAVLFINGTKRREIIEEEIGKHALHDEL
ncbi:hypothetical protein BO85DRAFT_434348 [Aspergillus piperis CBS 112811]|uniref:Uncharacterized protein n=1 Tax=Aspergillus piperis CBS 112811 TaxID=1448313 RepID=A0A8G1RAV8_9EURO|nr:hypothetical protein BO85DRAFT_434348 [Aspergillus piperis CBS 112811]RAH61677.1 hypothetical protein BO85DRAFT_434348 [Aspergillus piperis CBS 112811]